MVLLVWCTEIQSEMKRLWKLLETVFLVRFKGFSYFIWFQARRKVQNIGGATQKRTYFGQFVSDFQNSFFLWKLLTGQIIEMGQAAPLTLPPSSVFWKICLPARL